MFFDRASTTYVSCWLSDALETLVQASAGLLQRYDGGNNCTLRKKWLQSILNTAGGTVLGLPA